jgi:phage repressor protein C with HTH and peptisase S24 domain
MEPSIHDGDLVLAHIQSDVDSEKVAVIVYEDMPMIKRVKKLSFNEHRQHILLQSTNHDEEYKDIEVNEGSEFRICGLVKGVMRVQSE